MSMNAVLIALCLLISQNCFMSISLYINAARTKAYITETAAASVGVAMPVIILPSTNTGMAKVGMACIVILNISFPLYR